MRENTHGNYGFEDHGHCRVCGGYNGHHFVKNHSEGSDYTPRKSSGGSNGSAVLPILIIVFGAIGLLIPLVGVVLVIVLIVICALK